MIFEIITIFISLVFAFISGIARGFHHARRDFPNMSKAKIWIDPLKYLGGKENGFNQSWPWTADHAHEMMHYQILGLIFSGLFFSFSCHLWFIYLIWIWAAWWIEGRGFTLLYHVILPADPYVSQYSFTTWLKGWFSI